MSLLFTVIFVLLQVLFVWLLYRYPLHVSPIVSTYVIFLSGAFAIEKLYLKSIEDKKDKKVIALQITIAKLESEYSILFDRFNQLHGIITKSLKGKKDKKEMKRSSYE